MRRYLRPCLVMLWLSAELCMTRSTELRPRCPPPPPPPPPEEGHPNLCEEGESTTSGESTYKVGGHDVYINYMVGSHFEMKCDSVSQSAEQPALPRFTERVRVRRVLLRSCAPPAQPYARALAALNVSVTDALVLDELPAAPPLRPDHFEGLNSLMRLELHGLVSGTARLPHAVLAPLPALRSLALMHVDPGTTLESLPAGLYSLRLWFTGAKLVTLAGAPELHQLSVREKSAAFLNVRGALTLESLALSSPNSSVEGVQNLGSLQKLGIDYWSETRPEPWVECAALQQLSLMDSLPQQQTVLPDDWVARCPVLSELSIRRVPLAPLPALLLRNATALKTLRLSGCRLADLPWDLFNDSVQLISLDLSYNRLETLSSDVFFSLRVLKTLNLSNNLLTANVALALQPLSSLRELLLADNTRLSDLCEGGTEAVITMANPSPLQLMTDLTRLVLRNTTVSRVCQDWRLGMPQLKELDLTETSVTVLKYEDIVQQRSTPGAKMKVGGKNYTIRFDYSPDNYESIKSERVTNTDVVVYIKATVICDCSAYWAALVFRKGLRHAGLDAPRCSEGKDTLRNVSLDELTCAAPELCTELRGCSCVSRDDSQWKGGMATARCENRGLTAVPSPLPRGPVWRLLLANNSIASVNASQLPPTLHELDLRHNTLQVLDEGTATTLLTRRVQLAGNPLRCDCNALGLLRQLEARHEHIDLTNITCADGSVLPSLARLVADCTAPDIPVAAMFIAALLGVLAVAILVLLMSRPEARLRIKILLEQVGWLPRLRVGDIAGDASDGRLFDAFVSYAHEDEEWVRGTLVDRLEGGLAPYRLCVHYRDWAPGEWIPAQIAASVRASRRTLAVVSRHFLKSDWARLEFREAHAQARRDVTPRLIVLLLEDPALLPLDVEMRSFIENNTYVRWGDPWFWRKLEHAMPSRPRISTKTVPSKRSQVSPTVTPAKPQQSYCSAAPRALVPQVPVKCIPAR